MHIGPNQINCQKLMVHQTEMQTTEKHKYLGDTISSSGNNDANIKERCKTGHSAIAQIKSVLNEARF